MNPNSDTWPVVLSFAERMEAKLEKNRHKGDRTSWLNDRPGALMMRIEDELTELDDAIRSGESAEAIANECADIANFCMMVADVHLSLKKTTTN